MLSNMHAVDGVCVCVLLADNVSFPTVFLGDCGCPILYVGQLHCFQHLCVCCGGVMDALQPACCRQSVCLCVVERQCKAQADSKHGQQFRIYIGESLGPKKTRWRSSQPVLEEEQMWCSGPFVFCVFLQSIITSYGPL